MAPDVEDYGGLICSHELLVRWLEETIERLQHHLADYEQELYEKDLYIQRRLKWKWLPH